jgi:WD40 repeat protein
VPVSCNRSADRKLLAVGQNKGDVALYNYPATSKTSKSRTVKGHSGEVANTRFSIDDETLVTVGKHDRGILVWKVKNATVKEGGEGGAKKEEEKKE